MDAYCLFSFYSSHLLPWFQWPTCILTATNSGPDPAPKLQTLLSGAPPVASADSSPPQPQAAPFLLQIPPWPRACSQPVFHLPLPSSTQYLDIHQVLGFHLLGPSQIHPLIPISLSFLLSGALIIFSGPL